MRTLVTLAGLFTVLVLLLPVEARAHWRPGYHNRMHAIRDAFGGYFWQARAVAWCESRWLPWADNGQGHLGMFQMGAWARARYGHGRDPWSQSDAAAAYFFSSGRDWSPWTCRP